MFTSLKNTKKGFTLIELLVVIAIIGILSSVVLASLSTARAKSRDAKRISDIGQIQLALELFFDTSQSYPSTTPTYGVAYTGDDAAVQLLTAKGFLPQTPKPPSGTQATYAYKGTTAAGGVVVCTTYTCLGYGLGVALERNDNTVLLSDADVAQIDDGTNDFWGAGGGTSCLGSAAGAAPETCYDVKP
ncbi:MAG: hypothetical protein A3C93_02760 [Candidatus Lloydbacteria bacterium RIFCSPHIGHO2_02_FULL_54_17]|uniref:Type II secretion system protein GspG C-terminal domain-containing protein n=1 Tax=Candidatus Lloydbacteria bacterium RIFCSPHIGHO2_02_FULL_54_17 TaxID=1798664 RepID=A0A1G2DDJ8_9BACT|nr:MAG: hypothetical protein A2762_06010 [Candidatus Lloydbacteria bacterium RIFCSPHIGHO2_01_FULL_54_11]OGZ10940.1 MAG: hypothetical protein A3C93_02760 [Candidatus Lloydbacteria bacterium RIFCSPHIGHO2_02_FULL_54_17]OGZ14921.1 MAG: hypothetical protein A2948_05355 [Candidatus Lloydbacteria bacterium RIFCSPLOWO2_01_FULL_54_18]OGZ17166.1 MAG: hypothetical protein A3H76_04105 [Candidatus Lloydbacteria bacterium RIFCSPLOWO2_02_FULL_54_12]